MDKKTKGSVAELAVAAYLMENGWRVSMPIGENNRYDLIAEKKGRFSRIQVKFVTPKNGVLDVNCRSSNNWSVLHYTPEEIDAIAAYDSINKNIYFIPVAKIKRNLMKLRIADSKNNQAKKINLAKNFLSINFLDN
jgi:hypothetical protein